MNAQAQMKGGLRRHALLVQAQHDLLHLLRGSHRIVHALEFEQQAVAKALDKPPTMGLQDMDTDLLHEPAPRVDHVGLLSLHEAHGLDQVHHQQRTTHPQQIRPWIVSRLHPRSVVGAHLARTLRLDHRSYCG
jgi:hypothetical protein